MHYSAMADNIFRFGIFKNLKNNAQVEDMIYYGRSSNTQDSELDLEGTGLGFSAEYLINLRNMNDVTFVKGHENKFYISIGFRSHLDRRIEKISYSDSNGNSGTVSKVDLKNSEVSPLDIFANFSILFNEKFSVFAGLVHTDLNAYIFLDDGLDEVEVESESKIGVQLGAAFDYKRFRFQFTYHPVKNDLSGTYKESGQTGTVAAEGKYNQYLLDIGYLF